ncbi:MAG: hypothetical protein IJX68_03165 [Rikenellaceae bacterium]|nr:hypothetical protein [Rikenellaceae bacterium]
MEKTHRALVRKEVAGFANRIQLARPKTAKPAHMAKTHKCAGLQGGCWFCNLIKVRKTENSKTRPYGKNTQMCWFAGRLLVL